MILVQSESLDAVLRLLMLILTHREIIPIDILANRSDIEEPQIVLKANEEHAIIFCLKVHLLHKLGSPK